MMTRRLARTATKLSAIIVFLVFLVLFLDNHYEVLPSSIHNRLPLHHDGFVITDVTVQACSSLNPFRPCTLNPQIWERVDKDLYLDKSWTAAAYLHVRRRREEDIGDDDKVVLDIKIGSRNPGQDVGPKAGEWEARPEGIWVLRSSSRREFDSEHAVTAVDILYGPDAIDPRIGWTMRGTPLLTTRANTDFEPHITFRSGRYHAPEKPLLRIPQNGKFKIMQAADLHLSTGVGVCRDAEPPTKHCEADTRTLDFLGKLLDQEQPDLVILSGDQVNGETSPDVQSTIFKFADIFIKRHIPYAAIFGNHDDEGPWSRSTSMMLLQDLPYSLAQHGPTTISGVGNYVLEVAAPGSSTSSALSLYLLDTHSYSPNERHFHGYNWIKDDQIAWFHETAKNLRTQHKRYNKIHMDMAFIHIPLPEYRHAENRIVGEWREGVTAPYYNSGFRDALVEEGVLVVSAGHDHANDYCSLERENEGVSVQPGVDVKKLKKRDLHDHNTTHAAQQPLEKRSITHIPFDIQPPHRHSSDTRSPLPPTQEEHTDLASSLLTSRPSSESGGSTSGKPALWMCYGGGSGLGGYGGYGGYVRRVRFFEVEVNGATIRSWKRVESGETERRVDDTVLVEGGVVVDR